MPGQRLSSDVALCPSDGSRGEEEPRGRGGAGRGPGAPRLAEPTPARRPRDPWAGLEAGQRPRRRGGPCGAGGRGDSRWARAPRPQSLEALQRECVTPAEARWAAAGPPTRAGVQTGVQAAALAPGTASGAARARPGVAGERHPLHSFPRLRLLSGLLRRRVRGECAARPGLGSPGPGRSCRSPASRPPAWPRTAAGSGRQAASCRTSARLGRGAGPTPAAPARGARPAAGDWPAPPRACGAPQVRRPPRQRHRHKLRNASFSFLRPPRPDPPLLPAALLLPFPPGAFQSGPVASAWGGSRAWWRVGRERSVPPRRWPQGCSDQLPYL